MNRRLTETIAHHVLANLAVLPSSFIDKERTRSIIDKQFLLPEKLTFQDNGETVFRASVYGCQVTVASTKEFKILLADCTEDPDLPEYCLTLQLKDAPVFGVYLMYTELMENPPDSEALIGVSVDEKHWMPCSAYLQGTFLAGMEQIKDLGFGWIKCTNYKNQYDALLSFIKFHHDFYEVNNEGQEG